MKAAVIDLVGAEACATTRFGIAVSGGPDSLALLLLAHAAMPGRVEAATVDHGLRTESAAEAEFVARLCADMAIPHAILMPEQPISGSVQASARRTRYALLERWRATRVLDWVMTAHHADDQIETLVMRVNRSSGVAGLSGIRTRQGRILRPLLRQRHAVLADIVAAQGIVAVDDPSNRDARFDRARVRAVLNGCDLLDPVAAQASAEAVADADDAINWMVERLLAERQTMEGNRLRCNIADLPTEIVRRLMERGVAQMDSHARPVRGTALTDAIKALQRGDTAMLGNVMIAPDKTDHHVWTFRAAPPRRTVPAGKHSRPC